MIHENKFQLVDIDSGDSKAVQRIITGKITKSRRKQIEHAARVFNREWAAPYGISPNGYAYNCGCEHDCCGCLTGKGASVSYERWGKNDCAIITIWTSYNY